MYQILPKIFKLKSKLTILWFAFPKVIMYRNTTRHENKTNVKINTCQKNVGTLVGLSLENVRFHIHSSKQTWSVRLASVTNVGK